jgi:hypothetical protein
LFGGHDALFAIIAILFDCGHFSMQI